MTNAATTMTNTGKRYGALVIAHVVSSGRKAQALFRCDCGGLHETRIDAVKRAVASGFEPRCKVCIALLKSENGLQRFEPERYMQKRFGRLLVTGISTDASRKNVKSRLVCLCDCGGQAIVAPMHLTSGKTTSCGCFHQERQREVGKEQVVHGHTTFGQLNGHTSIYRAWMKIRGGCAEGIRAGFHRVCHEYDQRWDDFELFYADFGSIAMHETISRTDNQLTWCKDNCFINRGRRNPSKPLAN